ncbi:MAG: hypothetical protein OEZ13_08005 [Spirochaetia bacterium]|nr:hypothetical protein [Spirochaetia bacterium]
MKTAISIPDDLYKNAEKLADKLKITRSELYQRAIKSFLEDNENKNITKKLNDIYENRSSKIDSGIYNIQYNSLEKNNESW